MTRRGGDSRFARNDIMPRPRIVLADDHQEFLGLITGLLGGEFEVVEAVSDGESLVEAAARLLPDALVTDISMPGLSGIEAARIVLREGSTLKVVFLTVHQDQDFVQAALDTGATGYVIKGRMASELVPALRAVLAGGRFVSTT